MWSIFDPIVQNAPINGTFFNIIFMKKTIFRFTLTKTPCAFFVRTVTEMIDNIV